MSIKIMTEIWEHSNLKGTPLLLLLALADYANDQRICWPSVATVAAKSRISERQAQRLLKSLAAQGHIGVEAGGGRSGTNRYHLATVDAMKTLPEFKSPANGWVGDTFDTPDMGGVTPMTAGGDTLDAGEVTPVTPEPSSNHHRTIKDRERVLSLSPQADVTVPEPSPTPPPERVEHPKPKRERKPRAPSEWESQRHALAETFSAETDISPVVGYAELEKRWWSPLKAILAASKGDMERARVLIVLSVAQMRERQFTISSPQSIEQSAIALSATTRASPQKRTIRVRDPLTGQPKLVEVLA